jgi:hypothetical protein
MDRSSFVLLDCPRCQWPLAVRVVSVGVDVGESLTCRKCSATTFFDAWEGIGVSAEPVLSDSRATAFPGALVSSA